MSRASRPRRQATRPERATVRPRASRAISTELVDDEAVVRPSDAHIGLPWGVTPCLCGCHFGDDSCDDRDCRSTGDGPLRSLARAPLYALGSAQGGKHLPEPIGYVDSFGDHVKLAN